LYLVFEQFFLKVINVVGCLLGQVIDFNEAGRSVLVEACIPLKGGKVLIKEGVGRFKGNDSGGS